MCIFVANAKLMDKGNIQLRFGILLLIVMAAAMSRLLPHPPNFTPIGAMALFGAAHFARKSLAFIVPLVALWISDLVLNNVLYTAYYEGFQWLGSMWVYLAMGLIVLLGAGILKKLKPGRLLLASLSASMVFFLITNFGALFTTPLYPKTLGGLAAAYTAGLPFFLNTLLGDLFYTAVLFGTFELVRRQFLIAKPAV